MKRCAVNPYLPSWEYIPDGEPHVFGGRLYLFGSHDRFGGRTYCENDYVIWSAPINDLSDWRCHGISYRREQDPKSSGAKSHMFAPDVAQGADGRFYMYYGMDFVNRVAVAVSKRPEGPYEYYGEVHYADGVRFGGRDKELIRFDPAVLADDDGRIWLYTGFSPKDPWFQKVASRENMTINANGNQVAELMPDMLTIKAEPAPLLPGVDNAKGTGFEGHEFYEASSMRKFGGKYYAIYSSSLSHELAYAISDYPNKGFSYGGTLHSNGNVIREGESPTYFWGNNHGSVVEACGKYYVFGHRQTNATEFSRQGVAERIRFESGKFYPAEMTSQGLNGSPLHCNVVYEAGIACVLYNKKGACKTTEMNKHLYPYITQDGIDREDNPGQYVANVRNGTVIGYKYFSFACVRSVEVAIRGMARGEFFVSAASDGAPLATIPISFSTCRRRADMHVPDGSSALYFRFEGIGRLDLLSIRIISAEA